MPGSALQHRIQDHIGIEQHAHQPYFFILASSIIRSTSSSLGGWSVLQMPISPSRASFCSLETGYGPSWPRGAIDGTATSSTGVTLTRVPSGNGEPLDKTTTPFFTRPFNVISSPPSLILTTQ